MKSSLIPHKVPLSKVYTRLQEVWDNQVYSNNGPLVQEFSRDIAIYQNHRYGPIMTSSGTMGLLVSLNAIKEVYYKHVADKDIVVYVSNFTFPATYQAVILAGMKPYICDLHEGSYNIKLPDSDKIAKHSIILETSTFGTSIDINYLVSHNRPIIIDSCGSFLCDTGTKNLVDAEVFSFHGTKIVNAGEGGCAFLLHPLARQYAQRWINFGFNSKKDVLDGLVGFNGKMSEINAAMGLVSLESCRQRKIKVHKRHTEYDNLFNKYQNIKYGNYYAVNSLMYPEEYKEVQKYLALNPHIQVNKYFTPLINNQDKYPNTPTDSIVLPIDWN